MLVDISPQKPSIEGHLEKGRVDDGEMGLLLRDFIEETQTNIFVASAMSGFASPGIELGYEADQRMVGMERGWSDEMDGKAKRGLSGMMANLHI
jgi:hypothetical protein